MRKQRKLSVLLGALVAVAFSGGTALGDVTTEESASILVFPKVIADGTRDTLIQISNTSNSLVRAHCFYVNGALTDPSLPPSPNNPPLWQEVDFTIQLTRQQPTHWVVSRGRRVNPLDPTCSLSGVCVGGGNDGDPCQFPSDCDSGICSATNCLDSGFDPGLVPPVVPDFTGELKCIEVDASGAPIAGNHLKGEATLVTLSNGDISKYNGIGIKGENNNGDGRLVLGGGQCVGEGSLQGTVCTDDSQCGDSGPCMREYNGCPRTWILNHLAEGAPNPASGFAFDEFRSGGGSSIGLAAASVSTSLTVVPCTQNFETQEPTSVTLQFLTTNEFEQQFSVSTTITCWADFLLGDLGAPALDFSSGLPDPQGTMFLKTKIRSAAGTPRGVLMVAEERHVASLAPAAVTQFAGSGAGPSGGDLESPHAAAAVNLHVEGVRSTPDVIEIPAEQLAP